MLRHLHWWLAIAMLPLAISILLPNESAEELRQRFEDSIAAGLEDQTGDEGDVAATEVAGDSSETGAEGASPMEDAVASNGASPDDSGETEFSEGFDEAFLFSLMPGNKLKGALLARNSYMHWLFALLSGSAFMTLFVLLAKKGTARPLHLLGLGLVTATVGVFLLLFIQKLALIGMGGFRIRGILGLFVLVLVLIGLSYRVALDPEMGVVPSFLGFTAGVGFCEELVKALPLLIYFRANSGLSWRCAFLWGLASGTGFGIAEGIMYSHDMYNGISGPLIYLVRFISCVALHAIWSGSVGIAIQQRRDLLQNEAEEWWMIIIVAIRLMFIPMVLHGLYDTLLKKDMPLFALLTAFASFAYLAWMFTRLRGDEETASRAKFVAEYVRRRARGKA